MQLEIGQVVEGKVVGMTNFGAFVDFGHEKSGMVHISEISDNFVKAVSDVLQIGQEIKAKIVRISEKGEIALSIKKLAENKNLGNTAENSRANSSKLSSFEWKKAKKKDNLSFEEMMAVFKTASEEKMSALKKVIDARRGGSRRKK